MQTLPLVSFQLSSVPAGYTKEVGHEQWKLHGHMVLFNTTDSDTHLPVQHFSFVVPCSSCQFVNELELNKANFGSLILSLGKRSTGVDLEDVLQAGSSFIIRLSTNAHSRRKRGGLRDFFRSLLKGGAWGTVKPAEFFAEQEASRPDLAANAKPPGGPTLEERLV